MRKEKNVLVLIKHEEEEGGLVLYLELLLILNNIPLNTMLCVVSMEDITYYYIIII